MRRPPSAVAALVGVALVLAGCGGGGDDGDTTSTTATAAVPTLTTPPADGTTTGATGTSGGGSAPTEAAYGAGYERVCARQLAARKRFVAGVPAIVRQGQSDPEGAVAGFRRLATPFFAAIDAFAGYALSPAPPAFRRYAESVRPGLTRVRGTIRSAKAKLDRATTLEDLGRLAPKLLATSPNGGLPSPAALDRLAPSCVELGA